MAYLRHLIHRATIRRPTIAKDDVGQQVATLANAATNVPCRLHPRSEIEKLEKFGADVKCDAVVLFKFGTDIRPGAANTSGLADSLTIVDQYGRSTKWQVQSTSETAVSGKMLGVYVTRAET